MIGDVTLRTGMEVSANEFRELFERVSNWGRWGPDDERGALNYLTPEKVADAAGLVRSGRTVSLSRPLNTEREADNPEPADHHMTMLGAKDHPDGLAFAKDYIGVDYHNDSHSHLDALCHVSYDGSLYNGRPADSVSATGAAVETVEVLKDGLVGRGVLLDIPRARNVDWLEPGDSVLPGDLDEAERREGVTVGEGDILLVRTGHAQPPRRARPLGRGQLEGRAPPKLRGFPVRAAGRGTRLRRQQRYRAERHRGGRLSDPRPGTGRDGRPPARLPAPRGTGRSL